MNRLVVLAAGVIGVSAVAQGARQDQSHRANAACALITAAELESTIGGKGSGFNDTASVAPGDPDVCNGTAGNATIQLRLIPQVNSGYLDSWKKLAELTVQMGGHVDQESAGPISCRATTPPPALAASSGFMTSCTVSKSPKLAVIEVTTKAALVPIAKVRPLAVKMQSRF
jgi:hypothetical protein